MRGSGSIRSKLSGGQRFGRFEPDDRLETAFARGGRGASGGHGLPLGLLRFRASAEAYRRKLQAELLAGPLRVAEREQLEVWLSNLKTREAWHAARLEHAVAVKRMIIEALADGAVPRHESAERPDAARTPQGAEAMRDEQDDQ
jgi:hypothetical protein